MPHMPHATGYPIPEFSRRDLLCWSVYAMSSFLLDGTPKVYLLDRKGWAAHFGPKQMVFVLGRNFVMQTMVRLQSTLEAGEEAIANAHELPDPTRREEMILASEKAQWDSVLAFFLSGPNPSPWPQLTREIRDLCIRELLCTTTVRTLELCVGRAASGQFLDKLVKSKCGAAVVRNAFSLGGGEVCRGRV